MRRLLGLSGFQTEKLFTFPNTEIIHKIRFDILEQLLYLLDHMILALQSAVYSHLARGAS
jgi:hypothetical protein